MSTPQTRYTTVGDSSVAYQVFGKGPVDLVWVSGFSVSVDNMWDQPKMRHFLDRMASYSRVIMFDRRGSGNSDPVPLDALPTWEEWVEDVKAVLDAAGSQRAAIVGELEAGTWAMLFAATYPERTSSLVLWNSFARFLRSDDFPWGADPDAAEALAAVIEQGWGSEELVRTFTPSLQDDPALMSGIARYLRSCVTPRMAAALYRYFFDIDARSILPLIRVPTLVLRRAQLPLTDVGVARHLADNIDQARYVEIPGSDVSIWSEGADYIQDLIQEFVTGTPVEIEPDRVLATVLFTDIVASTELLAEVGDHRWREMMDEHDRSARASMDRFRGKLVRTTGDGLLATFDGPGMALRCASHLRERLGSTGLEIRAGVHTGEIEVRDAAEIGGIAVHIGARVMAEAGPGEVMCSRTVKDLVAGSQFSFEDRGTRSLKGVPEAWQLFALQES